MILLLKKIYINMKSSMFSNTFMFINCGSIYVYIYIYIEFPSHGLYLSRLSQHEWTTSFCPCKLSNKVSLRPPTSHLQDKHRQGVQNLFLLRYNSSLDDDNLPARYLHRISSVKNFSRSGLWSFRKLCKCTF